MTVAGSVRTMAAASISAPRQVEVAQAELPAPAQGQVLFRVEGCGVCGSTLPAWEGRAWFDYPLRPGEPGHEAWGEVQAGPEELVGRRVAALSYRGFAEYDVAAADAVVALPPELDQRPFPGEALACAVNVVRRAPIQAGVRVAVVGIGFLGAAIARLCVLAGAEVTALSRRPYALELARSLGVAAALPLEDEPAAESFDVAVECVGSQAALNLASRLVRTRGTLVIAGYHQDASRTVDMQSWNWRGLDVVNAHEREPQVYVSAMREAARLAAAGDFDFDALYTEFPLERLGDAFEAMRTRPEGFLKAVVRP
jgi:threonine dehydrogenase-like Zn-dependent dehydrogenase